MGWTYRGGGAPGGSSNPVIDGNLTASGFLDAAQLGRTWQAHVFSISGDGTSGNPWTGWEASVNALPIDSHVHFVGGYFAQSQLVTMKQGWLVTGDGVDATFITSAISGTAFRTNFAYPGIKNGYVAVRDLFLITTNIANNGSGLLETNGQFFEASNVKVQGYRYGISLVGTEEFNITHCELRHQTRAGIWLVSGSSYNTTNADLDILSNPTFVTNLGIIQNCQFNQLGFGAPPADVNPRAVGIAHDGGWTCLIQNNNFNGCTNAIRTAGANWLTISNSEFEGQSDDPIVLGYNKLNADGSSGPSGPAVLENNLVVVAGAGKFALRVDSCVRLTLIGNLLRQGTGATSAIVGGANASYVTNINSYTDMGTALFDVAPSTLLDLAPDSTGVIEYRNTGNLLATLNVRNLDAADTGAAAVLQALADSSAVSMRSHGTGRVATRWGVVTIARWNELLATAGLGLAVGTQAAFPLILGTNSIARMQIDGAGIVSIFAIPVYANNAAAIAGGLVAGGLYRTGADPDVVAVVH